MDRLDELRERLGSDYTINTIDGERVIYRDLGNKYNIEISGAARQNRPVNIYMWYGDKAPFCFIVDKREKVQRDDIESAITDLVTGYFSRDKAI